MMSYRLIDWLLFFFFYCIIGWAWESGYVSLKSQSLVNRGFLYGPWLPIYGFGALSILLATLPVREHLPLVFLLGMLSSTALEYMTGAAMEKLFHMRYWDYSDQPLNVNGYICLPVSLAWGCFSILLIRLIHPPAERLVLRIPDYIEEGMVLSLTVLIITDTVKSVQAALDLKALLASLTENHQTLSHIESRIGQISKQFMERSERFCHQMKELEESARQKQEQLRQEKQSNELSRKDRFMARLSAHRERESGVLSTLEKKVSLALEEAEAQMRNTSTRQEREHFIHIYHGLQVFYDSIKKVRSDWERRKNRDYRRAVSLLERNPGAVSQTYKNALDELTHLKRQGHGRRKKEKGPSNQV